jgi:hypothetical protein
LHDAVVPPLLPAQLHDHGPLPLTVDAVPAVQRLAVGALVRLPPFEEPHAPFTGCAEATFFAEQAAVVPPLLPAQLHDHGPLPAMVDAVPALQRLAVGALARLPPFEEPHAPFTGCAFFAEQVAVVPRPLPKQLHDHGPLPLTVDAVPELQRLAVGELVRSAPFEEPHAPSTNCACAEPRETRTQIAAARHLRIKRMKTSPP